MELYLYKIKENGCILFAPNKAKHNLTDEVMGKKRRWILHTEEYERFFKGWFCS